MPSLTDLRFVTQDGKVYGLSSCKCTGLGGALSLIRFRDCTFLFRGGKRVSLQIVKASSPFLEVKVCDETLVKGNLANFIGHTFELEFPVIKPPITIESICSREGLRIRNIYYDKDTKEIVIKTEEEPNG